VRANAQQLLGYCLRALKRIHGRDLSVFTTVRSVTQLVGSHAAAPVSHYRIAPEKFSPADN